MAFRQSAPDELSPPLPPPPPSTWLQRSVSDQPPPPPLAEMELRRSSPNQPCYSDLNEQPATRGNQNFYEGILLEEKEAISESKGVDMLSLELKVREENNIQDGTASTSVKAEVIPWSAWRATLSQTGRVLKTVKGILNILTPEKVDTLKDQPIASGITSADILKKDESISIPPAGNIITCAMLKASCTNPRLGDDYLNQEIGYDVGQGIGQENENHEILNKVHPKNQRDPEKETRNRGFEIGRANGDIDMFNNVDPDIQRAFEKQKIREEIIAAEMMARRRELEAEVREELRIERELALSIKKRGNAFDNVHVPIQPCGKSLMKEVDGPSLEDNIAMPVEDSLRIQGRTETSRMDIFPLQQKSPESKVNEPVQEKEKNIFLAKPSADVSATEKEDLAVAKESACTVYNAWGVGSIKGNKKWICFICQVTATSEADLKHHFTGNKHRSTLQAEKSAVITGKAVQTSQIGPMMPPLPPTATSEADLKHHFTGNKHRSTLQAEKSAVITGKAVQTSQIGPMMPPLPPTATSEADLKHHFTGNKHRSTLQAEKSAVITGKAIQTSQIGPMMPPLPPTATSEADLKHHFTGNKHRSKRATLQAEKSAVITGKAVQTSQIGPMMPPLLPIATKKPLDGLPENKNKAKGKEKLAFWCEMCNVGAQNTHLMEAHKKGKKHLSQLRKKFPLWCDLCKVRADREHIMDAHLKGKRHLTMLQEKAASTTPELGKSPLKIGFE